MSDRATFFSLFSWGAMAFGVVFCAQAEDSVVAGIHYNRDVRAILSEHCFACHGPDHEHREAGLRLDVRENAIRGGVISPGDSIYSDLIPIMEDVITRYMDDVKTRNYPGPENTIKMPEDELRKFAKDMKWERKLDELG